MYIQIHYLLLDFWRQCIYTVSEENGQVEVCVTLISYEGDISDETRVLCEVFHNTNPLNIPADAATASKSDHNILLFYVYKNGTRIYLFLEYCHFHS